MNNIIPQKRLCYFVTATNTDVGKSFASKKLLSYYASMGYKVGYYKPIETAVIDDKPSDGIMLLKLAKELNSDFNVDIKEVVPYRFTLAASPYVAKGDSIIDIEYLKAQKEYLQTFCDVLIVEGAGGLMVPIEKEFFMIDLIKELQCKAILISPSNLGSINDTMLSIKALKSHNIEFEWYINLYKDKESFFETSYPFLKDYFSKIEFLDDLKTNNNSIYQKPL